MNVEEKLRQYESMLHVATPRVWRALQNLEQEMGGYPSSTPGSGSPGGGKGGRPTALLNDPKDPVVLKPQTVGARSGGGPIDPDLDERWNRRPPTTVVPVPVTSVEAQALRLLGDDIAGTSRDELTDSIQDLLAMLMPRQLADVPTMRDPVAALVACTAVVHQLIEHLTECPWADELADRMGKPVTRIFHLTQRWGYVPTEPITDVRRAELLAVDLTEQWCTSHLRLGVKRPRYRGPLCQWCYRITTMVPTWDAPPLQLVRLHVDNGKVHAHELDEFVKAEKDRQRTLLAKSRRK